MPGTDTGSGTGNSLLPQTHGGLPSRRTSHSRTPGNLEPKAHGDTVRQGTGASTASQPQGQGALVSESLTCARQIVHSQHEHGQYRHHHLLRSGKSHFSSEAARSFLCVWG